jgi:hypothetical protein
MLLLNTDTLRLETFAGNKLPAYAILSHVWGLPNDEVSFEDMRAGTAEQKHGYFKLQNSCAIAVQDGLKYIWIDTCCIDKGSSAELSEAINSMFRYYAESKICYAYLEGVSSSTPDACFAESKWFTRGWTLQELIAPPHVRFLSQSWLEIGTKTELATEVSRITKVDVQTLKSSHHLYQASLAQRMSWASGRTTTRKEDLAYCLLGIFDVNMPLLYGEGSKAFIRLQKEIMKGSTDQSLFAWTPSRKSTVYNGGVLAQRPKDFSQASHIVRNGSNTHPYAMTNKGLQITLPIINKEGEATAILSCHEEGHFNGPIGIELKKVYGEEGVYIRMRSKPKVIEDTERLGAEVRPIYLLEDDHNTRSDSIYVWIRKIPSEKYGFSVSKFIAVSPASGVSWNCVRSTLVWSKLDSNKRGAVVFDHALGPGVVVFFGVRPFFVPWVHIFLLSQSQDDCTSETEGHFDFEQPMDTSSSNAVAYTALGTTISATIKWRTVMSEEVVVLDISAEGSSNMPFAFSFLWSFSEDYQNIIVSLISALTKVSLTLIFVFLERFFPMGEATLFRGPLWENRWDNFLFLFHSQFLRSILRNFIPQIVPLILGFYIGLLWLKFGIFVIPQFLIDIMVFRTKPFFPLLRLLNQLPFFWGFLDILGYTNEVSIMQDGFWFIYFLGINDFLSYRSFDFHLLCILYIPMMASLKTRGVIE